MMTKKYLNENTYTTEVNQHVQSSRREIGKIFKQYLALLAIIAFIAFAGSSILSVWELHVKVEGQLAKLEKEKSALLIEQHELQYEIEQLNTPVYIEKLAREILGFVKKGEMPIYPKN